MPSEVVAPNRLLMNSQHRYSHNDLCFSHQLKGSAMPESLSRRTAAPRWAAATAAAALAFGAALVVPQAASAAVAEPIPDGVYIEAPWVEPGGDVRVAFVGETPECGAGYGDGYSYAWSFVSSSGTTELQSSGFGEGYWFGRSAAFVDEEWNPLPIGQSGPVSGKLVLTCTSPAPESATASVEMDLTVRSTPPPTIYNSPTSWVWFAPDVGAGTVVTINALGFKPGEGATVSLVNGTKFFDSGSWADAIAGPVSVVADGEGAVTAEVTVPSGWGAEDALDLMIGGASSKYLLVSGSGSPLEGEPSLALTSNEGGFPGSAVAVSASGFDAGETVQIALHSSSAPAVPIGTLTANGSGAISGIVYVPSSQPVGSYRLWAGAASIGYLLLNAPLEITAVPTTDRLSGPDRFQTAVAISQESFEPGVERVYIASGLNFPDALSAGALAAQKGAPVLLTHPDTLLDAVRTELNRLEPATIILVGGTPSVSNTVKSALEALEFEPEVTRIAGPDRFATNRLLVGEAFQSAPATTVFIATGLKFPDALAAAPAAAEGGGAVVLVNGGAASLDAATLQLLDSLDVVDVRIVGDPASVSSGIENQLKTLYPGHVQRFAGADRYATAAKIVAATWPGGASDVILASGVNFPDALAASALGQPMLTSLPSCIPGVILAELGNLAPSKVTLVGDAGALSTAVQNNFTHC